MDHLLGLCTLFPLFLSSSSNFCGLQYPDPKLDKANVIPEYSGATKAPWLVNIYGNGQRCQGVILSSLWVLTAANCFLLMNPSQVELTGSPGHFSTKAVSRFLLHRGFSSWNTAPNNDLGLILLAQPVDLTEKDMWPACIPQEEKPYNTQEECRIFERGQEGSMRWFLKETMVEALSVSDCSKHWPNTTEGRNLCMEKKDSSNFTSCKVPVGSPVICHDPVTWEWEVMGLVSQSLHNCTIPILASQLLSHKHWLKRVGALENPLQPEDKLPSAAGQQQPVTLLGPATVQTPSATLQVPVLLPAAKPIFKLPSSEAAITVSLPSVQAITTTATKLSSINLPSLEATLAAISASPSTKPPTLETIVIMDTSKLLPRETTTATVIELPSTSLPLLEAVIAATTASPLTSPPALETSMVTKAPNLLPMKTITASVTELPSTSPPLPETSMAITTPSPSTKPPVLGTITIIEVTKPPPMETTTTTITTLPSTTLTSLGVTTVATTASPPTKPPTLETITTEVPRVEKNTTTRLSLNQIAKQLGAVSSTTKNSNLPSSKAANPAQETNSINLTTAHESSPTTSASFSSAKKPQHGTPTQETPSVPRQPTTAEMTSTKFSITSTQQSSVASVTSPQLSSVVSPVNKRRSVTRITKSFSQTPKQQNVELDPSSQPTSSTTSNPSTSATQTLVASTTRQSLQSSFINTHHHIVITPSTYPKQSKPLSSPGTR